MKNFTKAQIRALKERTDFDNMTLEELKAVMTKKQQLFCEEYLIDLNGTQAAKRAGYSAKTSCAIGVENLRKPLISAYIRKRLESKERDLLASQDEVLQYLTATMRREKKESIVVTVQEEESCYKPDERGTMRKVTVKKEKPVVVEIPAKLNDSNKAGELLGKYYKLFTDKTEVSGAVPVVIAGDDDILE